jgi:glycine dehydrogenase
MSWPVAGTLMLEPTESESKAELDRYIDALRAIREEARAIASGNVPLEQSALRNAPHTASDLLRSDWARPYALTMCMATAMWSVPASLWMPTPRRQARRRSLGREARGSGATLRA